MRQIVDHVGHFWARVAATGSPCECWFWTASKTSRGYGQVHWQGGKNRLAHRVSFELTFGAVPDGLQLDHLCRNRDCVNPWHLEPVSGAENIRRGHNQLRARTHCKHGHLFTTKNTRIRPSRTGSGTEGRTCLTCESLRNRKVPVLEWLA